MRLASCALLLAAFAFFATTTHAQKAAPTDAQAVANCLKKADDDGNLGWQCIGLIADPCANKSGAGTEQIKTCAARELSVWSGVLETALKSTKAGGFKEIESAVTESQKSWAASRDKLCPVFDKIDPGMMPGGGAYCRLQETARRALLVRRLATAVGEH